MAKPPKLPKLGRFWRFGRAWLSQPSEFYDEINFLGINCCSTYKKVSKNPHFLSIYFREHEIQFYRAVPRGGINVIYDFDNFDDFDAFDDFKMSC